MKPRRPKPTKSRQTISILTWWTRRTCLLKNARQPIAKAPPLVFGNMPNDGGNLLLTKQERDELLKKEPRAAAYIRRFIGSEEYYQ